MHPELQAAADFIRDHLQQGIPEMHIREHFLKHGWTSEWFNTALKQAKAQDPVQIHHNSDIEPMNTSSESPVRKKYKIIHALRDTYRAIARNPRPYFIAVGSAGVVMIASFFLIEIIIFFLISKMDSGLSAIIYLLLCVTVFLAWYALSTTFFMVLTSEVLATPRKISHFAFKANLRQALKLTPRAALSSAVGFAITWVPPIILFALSIILAFASLLKPGFLLLTVFLQLLALCWLFIMSLRLSLVQQVAVFEKNLTIKQTLARSNYLLQKGGQWFIVKGLLLLLLIEIILSIVTGTSLNEIEDSNNIFTNLILILATIITQGVLLMLYLNRRQVRDN